MLMALYGSIIINQLKFYPYFILMYYLKTVKYHAWVNYPYKSIHILELGTSFGLYFDMNTRIIFFYKEFTWAVELLAYYS